VIAAAEARALAALSAPERAQFHALLERLV